MKLQIKSGAFDILYPEIKLIDIAWNLSGINRYLGATDITWSVVQHLILCDELVQNRKLSNKLRLAVLLHDAPEYIVNDQNGVYKKILGQAFEQMEDKIERAIAAKFGIEPELFQATAVKDIDKLALYIESKALFSNRVPALWNELDAWVEANKSDVDLNFWIGALKELVEDKTQIKSREELAQDYINRVLKTFTE